MWDLGDRHIWQPVGSFKLPWASTYADTRPGRTDREKREQIRKVASTKLAAIPPDLVGWGFRIYIRKSGKRPFDIENVPKLIVDAFCARQITRDDSRHTHLSLYPDDTIDHVVSLQVAGERVAGGESTLVEVFGRRVTATRGVALTSDR